MEQLTPAEFGQRVARKRGSMGIRAAAAEIGISAATLSRIERGHVPDIRTLSKVCAWVGIDPRALIGGAPPSETQVVGEPRAAVQIAFKSGQSFAPSTAKSLATQILAARESFIKKIEGEGH